MPATSGTLRLGTSSWSSKDWVGKVYPVGTKPADFITHYAKIYSTVEIDSTFYGVPRRATVEGWRDRTPEDFLFATKAPKAITHEKFLVKCERDVEDYLDTMSLLGKRLGPILFQFPYYAKRTKIGSEEFLTRLEPFLAALPHNDFRFAVEVRNKAWIEEPLLSLLKNSNVTLALIDHPWMAPPAQLFKTAGIETGDFLYVRWLGDRHGIEKRTKTWNETIVDRTQDLKNWAPPIKERLDNQMDIFGYVNNHYAGYAPDNVDQMKKMLE